MLGKRTEYSAEFKAKMASKALCGELTAAQFAAKHGIHQTMIGEWKRQATEGLVKFRPSPGRGGPGVCPKNPRKTADQHGVRSGGE